MKKSLRPFARPLAAALLAVGLPSARLSAANLTVDGATSPYAITTSQSNDTVVVGNTGTGTINHSAGTFAVGQDLYLGYNGTAAGTYNLSNTGVLNVANGLILGYVGGGDFEQTGGSATFTGNGTYIAEQTGSSGLYHLTSGSVVVNGTGLFVGFGGSGVITQSGGMVTVSSGPVFHLAEYAGSTGSYTLGGTGQLSAYGLDVGIGGTGTFTQNGGTFTTNGSQLTVSGSAGTTQGTYNLNGGTLTTGNVSGYSGTSTFHFNGGTLQAAADSTSFVVSLTVADVQAGGAKIDTNGYNVTISQSLVTGTAAGTKDGGLTKIGTGILTLSAANTYTGTTAVNAGTLAISANGGLAKGNVTIAAGSTLTLAAGVTAAHNASTGTTLTLAATSTINLNATIAGTVQDTYGAIVIAGVSQLLPGTYGSATSNAAHVFPEFTGNGDVLLTPVPEPGTWTLLGVGMGLLGASRRCRRSRCSLRT